MKKSLLYFSILIIVSNFLFFLIGFTNNIGFVGAFMGGLMAIGTDPIIIMMAIIIGTVLVIQQFRFSVIFFILTAIVGATVVHFMLGTTKFIVDIIRVDVLLIIPSIIIVVASFFGPKSKPTKAKLIKVDPSTLKPIRLLILIFSAAISGFILFADTTGGHHRITDTFFGKYVSKSLVKPFHMERYLNRCKVKDLKSSCYNYGESRVMRDLTVAEINAQIKTGQITVLKNKTLKSTYKISMWITHIILFIIFMVIVFKLRFCIAHILLTRTETARSDTKLGGSNLSKTIEKFFKNI